MSYTRTVFYEHALPILDRIAPGLCEGAGTTRLAIIGPTRIELGRFAPFTLTIAESVGQGDDPHDNSANMILPVRAGDDCVEIIRQHTHWLKINDGRTPSVFTMVVIEPELWSDTIRKVSRLGSGVNDKDLLHPEWSAMNWVAALSNFSLARPYCIAILPREHADSTMTRDFLRAHAEMRAEHRLVHSIYDDYEKYRADILTRFGLGDDSANPPPTPPPPHPDDRKRASDVITYGPLGIHPCLSWDVDVARFGPLSVLGFVNSDVDLPFGRFPTHYRRIVVDVTSDDSLKRIAGPPRIACGLDARTEDDLFIPRRVADQMDRVVGLDEIESHMPVHIPPWSEFPCSAMKDLPGFALQTSPHPTATVWIGAVSGEREWNRPKPPPSLTASTTQIPNPMFWATIADPEYFCEVFNDISIQEYLLCTVAGSLRQPKYLRHNIEQLIVPWPADTDRAAMRDAFQQYKLLTARFEDVREKALRRIDSSMSWLVNSVSGLSGLDILFGEKILQLVKEAQDRIHKIESLAKDLATLHPLHTGHAPAIIESLLKWYEVEKDPTVKLKRAFEAAENIATLDATMLCALNASIDKDAPRRLLNIVKPPSHTNDSDVEIKLGVEIKPLAMGDYIRMAQYTAREAHKCDVDYALSRSIKLLTGDDARHMREKLAQLVSHRNVFSHKNLSTDELNKTLLKVTELLRAIVSSASHLFDAKLLCVHSHERHGHGFVIRYWDLNRYDGRHPQGDAGFPIDSPLASFQSDRDVAAILRIGYEPICCWPWLVCTADTRRGVALQRLTRLQKGVAEYSDMLTGESRKASPEESRKIVRYFGGSA